MTRIFRAMRSLPRRLSVAAVLVAAACSGEATGAKGRPAPPPVPVSVATAQRKTVSIQLDAVGTVVPIQTVSVRARVGGQIMSVGFQKG